LTKILRNFLFFFNFFQRIMKFFLPQDPVDFRKRLTDFFCLPTQGFWGGSKKLANQKPSISLTIFSRKLQWLPYWKLYSFYRGSPLDEKKIVDFFWGLRKKSTFYFSTRISTVRKNLSDFLPLWFLKIKVSARSSQGSWIKIFTPQNYLWFKKYILSDFSAFPQKKISPIFPQKNTNFVENTTFSAEKFLKSAEIHTNHSNIFSQRDLIGVLPGKFCGKSTIKKNIKKNVIFKKNKNKKNLQKLRKSQKFWGKNSSKFKIS